MRDRDEFDRDLADVWNVFWFRGCVAGSCNPAPAPAPPLPCAASGAFFFLLCLILESFTYVLGDISAWKLVWFVLSPPNDEPLLEFFCLFDLGQLTRSPVSWPLK